MIQLIVHIFVAVVYKGKRMYPNDYLEKMNILHSGIFVKFRGPALCAGLYRNHTNNSNIFPIIFQRKSSVGKENYERQI